MLTRTRRLCAALIAAAAMVAVAPGANAAIVAEWSTVGYDPTVSATITGTSPDPNVTAGLLSRGPGLVFATAAGTYSSNSWGTAHAGTPATDTEYMSFMFTINPGYEANLTQFNIHTRSSAAGPGTLRLYSSVDGFTTSLYTFTQGSNVEVDNAIALSLTGLTGAIEFRLIEFGNTRADGSGATDNAGTFRIRANTPGQTTINFIGTVSAIPVPAPAALPAGLALAGLIMLRRRRSM